MFNCSETIAFSKISRFWEKYGNQFPIYIQKYFKANIFEIIENNSIEKVDEVSKSIFCYLGLLTMEADKEGQFISFFEQYFNTGNLFNKNFVDIGQGYLPTLANKISEEKAKHSFIGKVKTFNPNLILSGKNMECFYRSFEQSELDDSADIVVSFSPRENAEKILNIAIEKNKELLLNFDGYIPKNKGLSSTKLNEFISCLYSYSKKNIDSNFEADIVNYTQADKALVLKKK